MNDVILKVKGWLTDILCDDNFLPIVALMVAICSMYVASQTWRLKKGHKVRGAYYIRSCFDSSCTYISNVILENLNIRRQKLYSAKWA